jgi:vacuolar-type H+-ATPase subunit D/Vma8
MSIYTDNGYTDRAEYLDELREEYGELVDILITVLPASEDFDGLVSELEDAAYSNFELIGA